MKDVKIKTVAEIPFYQGQGAIAGIRFHMAAAELGVTAWGMNVLEIEAGCQEYPEHDHVKDNQEEVYVVLKGTGILRVGEADIPLQKETLIRVGPKEKRKIIPGPEGITVLAIGATPGKAYEPRR